MTKPADTITEFPGEDDWLGWVDLLTREDTGTIDCVPMCMRADIMDCIGPDGRLNDPHLVPPTPYGVAKFCNIGRPLPWSGMHFTPGFIQELLDRGFSLDDIKAEGEIQKARGKGLPSPPVNAPLPPVTPVTVAVEQRAANAKLAPLPGFTDLYFIRSEGGPIKIGVSTDPAKRLRQLQTAHPFRLELLCVVPEGGRQEPAYHERFAEHRMHGEWFSPAPKILAEITRLSTQGEAAA